VNRRNTLQSAVVPLPTCPGSGRHSRKLAGSAKRRIAGPARFQNLAEAPRAQSEREHVPAEAQRPVEVDLDSRSADEYLQDGRVDLVSRLEEVDPADPGILSGASLRIMDIGPQTRLTAEIDAIQRDGTRLSHCIGTSDDPAPLIENDLTSSAEKPVQLWLRELEYRPRTGVYSGATIQLFGGEAPELLVCVGPHAVGVLRGRSLTAFLDSLNFRLSRPCDGPNL